MLKCTLGIGIAGSSCTSTSGLLLVEKLICSAVNRGTTVSADGGSRLGMYPTVMKSELRMVSITGRSVGAGCNIEVIKSDADGPTLSSGMTYSFRLIRE